LTDLTNLQAEVSTEGGWTDDGITCDLPPIPPSLKHGLPTAYEIGSLGSVNLHSRPAGYAAAAPGYASRDQQHTATVHLPGITEPPDDEGYTGHLGEVHPYLTYRITADEYGSREGISGMLSSHGAGMHEDMAGWSYQESDTYETEGSTPW
jgi:hypothetical protein